MNSDSESDSDFAPSATSSTSSSLQPKSESSSPESGTRASVTNSHNESSSDFGCSGDGAIESDSESVRSSAPRRRDQSRVAFATRSNNLGQGSPRLVEIHRELATPPWFKNTRCVAIFRGQWIRDKMSSWEDRSASSESPRRDTPSDYTESARQAVNNTTLNRISSRITSLSSTSRRLSGAAKTHGYNPENSIDSVISREDDTIYIRRDSTSVFSTPNTKSRGSPTPLSVHKDQRRKGVGTANRGFQDNMGGPAQEDMSGFCYSPESARQNRQQGKSAANSCSVSNLVTPEAIPPTINIAPEARMHTRDDRSSSEDQSNGQVSSTHPGSHSYSGKTLRQDISEARSNIQALHRIGHSSSDDHSGIQRDQRHNVNGTQRPQSRQGSELPSRKRPRTEDGRASPGIATPTRNSPLQTSNRYSPSGGIISLQTTVRRLPPVKSALSNKQSEPQDDALYRNASKTVDLYFYTQSEGFASWDPDKFTIEILFATCEKNYPSRQSEDPLDMLKFTRLTEGHEVKHHCRVSNSNKLCCKTITRHADTIEVGEWVERSAKECKDQMVVEFAIKEQDDEHTSFWSKLPRK